MGRSDRAGQASRRRGRGAGVATSARFALFDPDTWVLAVALLGTLAALAGEAWLG
jgi:hypothetical protein